MSRNSSLFRKITYLRIRTERTLKRQGLLFLLRKIKNRIKHSSFQTTCSIWFCKALDETIAQVDQELDINIEFLIEDKSKLIRWLKMHHRKYPWMFLKEELSLADSDNHVFVALFHENNIIGYIKIGINDTYIHDFDKVISFSPGDAFIYDTFILPEYRGKNLAYYALVKSIDFLRNESRKNQLWCHIEAWNKASLKVFKKAGFEKRGSIRFCRIFGLPFYIKNGYRPFLNLGAFLANW